MRRTILTFTTVTAATLLALITVFLPNLPAATGPLVMSALVVIFALTWPRLVSSVWRWDISAALGIAGLLAIWSVALLPVTARFSTTTTELWLAPVGGAVAVGVLAVFIIQIFSLPGGVDRFLTTSILALGAVIAVTSAGWTMLLRNKYEVAIGSLGVERISGVTWLMLTIFAALAAASLLTLLPGRRGMRMIAVVIGAILVAVALQILRPGPLSVPAVVAAGIAGLLVALVDSFADSTEAPIGELAHPLTAVAVGSGTVMATGMVSYFVIHALPW